MPRKTSEEIGEMLKREGVDRLFSWTKIDTFMTSPYEYFLKYIKKVPEDRTDCVYGNLGSAAHDILEKFYSNQIAYTDMKKEFDDAWTTFFDIMSLKFDRNDEEKNTKIANKYKENLNHFFMYHKPIEAEKIMLEQFAKIKIGNELFQGYIDVCYKDKDGFYNIIDWKTSSKYQGVKIHEKCGQLVLYALSLMQQGIDLNKIRIGWNFLKYVNVKYRQKKKDAEGNFTVKERTIERSAIGSKLQSSAKTWLKHFGYSVEQINQYLEQMVLTNNVAVLPDEVRAMFEVNDCYVFVEDLSQQMLQSYIDLINTQLTQIDYLTKEYNETGNEKVWWDEPENVKKESYYFATLCGYSATLHKPYAEYLESLEQEQKEKQDAANLLPQITNESVEAKDDMSWLDSI